MSLTKTLILEALLFLFVTLLGRIALAVEPYDTVRLDVWILSLYLLYPLIGIVFGSLLAILDLPLPKRVPLCLTVAAYAIVSIVLVFGGKSLFNYDGTFAFGPYLAILTVLAILATVAVGFLKGKAKRAPI